MFTEDIINKYSDKDKIRRLRKFANHSQKQMSRVLVKNNNCLSEVESGRREIDSTFMLCYLNSILILLQKDTFFKEFIKDFHKELGLDDKE